MSNRIIYILSHLLIFVVGVVAIMYAGMAPTAARVAIAAGIGSSLIAAAIAGWVVFVHVVVSERDANRQRRLDEAGLKAVFRARSISIRSEYDLRIDDAKNHADIIGFGLSSLREDHLKDFGNWKKRVPIRILLLDPEFPSPALSYASQRDREESNVEGTIRNEIIKFAQETRSLWDDQFQVRLYRCLPLLNIFRIDDEILWGPFLVGQQSRNTPTFLCKRGGYLFEQLTNHFEEIWNNKNLCREVPDEWLFPRNPS